MKRYFSISIPIVVAIGICACTPVEGVETSEETVSSGPCFATDTAPALIETETVNVLETAEVLDGNGDLISPAVYRSEIKQTIVRERQSIEFETPCNVNTSPEFVATLQRSLKARGHFTGEITGIMDDPTKRAISSYQSSRGLNSSILSLASAQELGLIAHERDSL